MKPRLSIGRIKELAHCAIDRGDFACAKKYATLLKTRDPLGGQGYYHKIQADIDYSLGRWESALQQYTMAIENGTESSRSTFLIGSGSARARLGDFLGALSDYENALASPVINPRAPQCLSVILSAAPHDHIRNGIRALGYANVAYTFLPNDWQTQSALAAAHAELGHFQYAIRCAEEALSLCPDHYRKERLDRIRLYREHRPFRLSDGKIDLDWIVVADQ